MVARTVDDPRQRSLALIYEATNMSLSPSAQATGPAPYGAGAVGKRNLPRSFGGFPVQLRLSRRRYPTEVTSRPLAMRLSRRRYPTEGA